MAVVQQHFVNTQRLRQRPCNRVWSAVHCTAGDSPGHCGTMRGRHTGTWTWLSGGDYGSRARRESRGFPRGQHQAGCPQSRSHREAADVNSAWAPRQAAISISKLWQNKSKHVDIAIKHIRQLLEFFKEIRVSSFVNCCNIIKQISTRLEIEIKDYHIQRRRTLFSHEVSEASN